MKLKRLPLSLLVLCVMVTSCQKDTYQNYGDTEENKATIKTYRSYFYNVVRKQQQTAVKKSNVLSEERENVKVHPNWGKATLSETDKYELLEVPIFHGNERFVLYNFDRKGKKSTVIDETVVHSVFKRLVMYKNKAGIIKERILTYIPDKTYLEKNGPDISHNRINKLDKNFSGYIEYSDINKNRLFVLLFKDGKAVLKRRFKSEKVATSKPKTVMSMVWCGEDCYEYYEWTCVGSADDPDSFECSEPELVDSWCDPIYCDEEPPGDDDPCLDPANMNTAMCGGDDGGGDGGGGNPIPDIIIYDISDPCLKSMVINTLSLNLKNEISQTINLAYGKNPDLDIRFDNATLVNSLDATTLATGNGSSYCRVDITLNTSLNLGSKEYIAATIFHEVLHSFIFLSQTTDGANNTNSHERMSDTANFNIMVDALKEMYPNLSSQSAIDLTWGGLQETQAYNALSQSDKNRIIQTNTDYKNGSNGATCQ